MGEIVFYLYFYLSLPLGPTFFGKSSKTVGGVSATADANTLFGIYLFGSSRKNYGKKLAFFALAGFQNF